MIPNIYEFVEMHKKGEIPIWILVSHVVKNLSITLSQTDFDALPDWLRARVRDQIASYKASGGWLMLGGNSEAEDYGPYADEVIRKIDLSS